MNFVHIFLIKVILTKVILLINNNMLGFMRLKNEIENGTILSG